MPSDTIQPDDVNFALLIASGILPPRSEDLPGWSRYRIWDAVITGQSNAYLR